MAIPGFNSPTIPVSVGGFPNATRLIVLMPNQIDGEDYYIHGLPATISISTAPAGQCSTVLSASGCGFQSYLWTPGGATTSSITVLSGTYTVTGFYGCNSSSSSASVTIVPTNTPECCNESISWTTGSYTSSTGTFTWTASSNPFSNSNPVYVENELRIPASSDISIDNMTFRFGLNARVIVEPGGKLTLNGTLFTAAPECPIMWEGVTVIGDKNNSGLAAQGRFFMKDNAAGTVHSRIERAYIGVINWDYIANNTNSFGGYFNLDNAEIANCVYGVAAIRQNVAGANYQSTLNNCTFSCVTGSLLYPHNNFTRTNNFVLAYANHDQITFTGTNRFTNSDNAIRLLDATGYSINGNIFTTNGTGIFFARLFTTAFSNLDINGNTFDRFNTGIRIDGGLFDDISENIFNTAFLNNPADPNGSQALNFSAIELNTTSGFVVHNNDFHHLKSGVRVSNSGSIGGRISANSQGEPNQFISCWRGVQTYGDNSNLIIKCNYFQNLQGYLDFATAWYTTGQLANQGSNGPTDKDPAGNDFFRFPPTRIDIISNNVPFTYFHHSFPLSRIPTESGQATLVNTFLNATPASCEGINLMELADNNIDSAIRIINQQTDTVWRQILASELVNILIRSLASAETIINTIDSIKTSGARPLSLLYAIYSGAFAKADSILDIYSGVNAIENNNFVAFYYWLIDSAQADFSAPPIISGPLGSAAEQLIRGIAISPASVAVLAQNIINYAYHEYYGYTLIDSTESRFAAQELNNESSIASGFQLFPNPGKDIITAVFTLQNSNDAAQMIISDLAGRKMFNFKGQPGQTRIFADVSGIHTGSYLAELKINNYLRERKKLILIK